MNWNTAHTVTTYEYIATDLATTTATTTFYYLDTLYLFFKFAFPLILLFYLFKRKR